MIKDIITLLRESVDPLPRLKEALLLRLGGHRLTLSEYIDYQLHTDQTLTAKERQQFIGEDRKWRVHMRCNLKQWFMLHYKIPYTQFMMSTETPAPKIFAIYGTSLGSHLPGALTLRNESAAIEWLTNDATFPLFVKPNDAQLGEGAIGLAGYSKEQNTFTLINGQQESMADFKRRLQQEAKSGLLFQKLLRPSTTIATVCGKAISSIRITLGRTEKGLQVISVCWRIPAGDNMIDNFRHGVSGNLLGAIDIATGRVTRVCGRVGNKIDTVKYHPDTGFDFKNFVIPEWQKIIEMCKQAGEYMVGLNIQNWDVALTDKGPVITEINVFGDMDIHQHVNRKGFRSEILEEVLNYTKNHYLGELSFLEKKLLPVLQKIDSLR